MKVNYCWHEVERPAQDGSYPGRITEGYYIVEDGELVMTNPGGEPVWVNGRDFRHKLAPDEVPEHIAKRLTREIFDLVNGDRISRPLVFPNVGVA